jgi:hypothetical protein
MLLVSAAIGDENDFKFSWLWPYAIAGQGQIATPEAQRQFQHLIGGKCDRNHTAGPGIELQPKRPISFRHVRCCRSQ